MIIISILGSIILSVGIISGVISAFGMLKVFKDIYSKVHSSGINDSFAIPLIIIGTGLIFQDLLIIGKLLITIFFIMTTCATTCHCICSIYYKENLCNNHEEN